MESFIKLGRVRHGEKFVDLLTLHPPRVEIAHLLNEQVATSLRMLQPFPGRIDHQVMAADRNLDGAEPIGLGMPIL